MAQVNGNMLISDALKVDEDIAGILMQSGMPCIGCLMASGETIEQAASVHGVDSQALIAFINDYLSKKAAN